MFSSADLTFTNVYLYFFCFIAALVIFFIRPPTPHVKKFLSSYLYLCFYPLCQILNQLGLVLKFKNILHLIPLISNITVEGFLFKWLKKNSLFTLNVYINESLIDVQKSMDVSQNVIQTGIPVGIQAGIAVGEPAGIADGVPAGIAVGKQTGNNERTKEIAREPIMGMEVKNGGYLNKKQGNKILKDSCRSIFS